MNFRQLRHFLITAEEGSLGRAAEKLHLSQPAISKSIQKLEDDLGVPVLERGPRGMTPTAFGQALIPHIRLIGAQVAHAQRDLAALKGLTRGHLAFGVGPSMALSIVPPAVSRLIRRHPGISISAIEGFAETLTEALTAGKAEFIIAPNLSTLPADLVTLEQLYSDRVTVVCRTGHPLSRRRDLTMRDLAEMPWVLPLQPDGFREYLEITFQSEGLVLPKPVWESNSMHLMKAALCETDAVALLPLPAISDDKRLQGLRHSPIGVDRKVFVIRRARGVLSPLAEAFLDELRREAARIGGVA